MACNCNQSTRPFGPSSAQNFDTPKPGEEKSEEKGQ